MVKILRTIICNKIVIGDVKSETNVRIYKALNHGLNGERWLKPW